MSNQDLFIVGAGGHAAACIDVIERCGQYRIIGLLGVADEIGKQVLGYTVVGSDLEIAEFAARCACALIGIGQIKSPKLRLNVYELLKAAGSELPVIVSPQAYVSPHARIGEGTIVMHGAIVNARASIGRNCIINSNALIEHDVEIGDHCHVATSAVVNGGAKIGSETFIGSNCTLRQGVRVGKGCVIGMAQAVRADCVDGTQLPGAGALQ